MKVLTFIGMIVDMIVLYIRRKEDESNLRLSMLKTVDKAFQKFASDVQSGNEDAVSKALSDLLNK